MPAYRSQPLLLRPRQHTHKRTSHRTVKAPETQRSAPACPHQQLQLHLLLIDLWLYLGPCLLPCHNCNPPTTMQHHRQQVITRYRELLRLINRMPEQKAAAARTEAQQTVRQHKNEADPEAQLRYLEELVARISFLRITTPRRPGEPLGGGTYVLRDGELVQGAGEEKGSRVADGSMSMEQAKRLNREHYKRFYGKPMPKEMFF